MIATSYNKFFSGLKDFLDKSAIELQTVFDSACGFRHSNESMTDEVEHVVNQVSFMKESAIELRHATSCTNSSTSRGMLCHNFMCFINVAIKAETLQ